MRVSEYVFLSSYQGRPVRVRFGWRRSSQRYYLLVEFTERAGAPIYCNEADPKVSRYTPLDYFLRKLVGLGVAVPKTAVRGLTLAPLRDGTMASSGASQTMRGRWKR